MRFNHLVRRISIIIAILASAGVAAGAAGPNDPVNQAKKRASDAQSELSKATIAFSAVVVKAQKQLQTSPEWKQLAADVKEAQAKHATAERAVREKLRKQPDYQAAVAERSRKQAARDAAREQPNPKQEQITQAAVNLLSAEAAVTRIETQALSSDENVTQTKEALDEANRKLAALNKTVGDLAKKDPAYEPARQRVEQAAAKASDANKQLADAKAQQDKQDEQKMSTDVENRKDQLRNITGFRR